MFDLQPPRHISTLPNSDLILRRSEMTRCANRRHSADSIGLTIKEQMYSQSIEIRTIGILRRNLWRPIAEASVSWASSSVPLS